METPEIRMTIEQLVDLIDGRIKSLIRRIGDPREPHEVKIVLKIRLEELKQLRGIYYVSTLGLDDHNPTPAQRSTKLMQRKRAHLSS
jgi:hypothetical protein